MAARGRSGGGGSGRRARGRKPRSTGDDGRGDRAKRGRGTGQRGSGSRTARPGGGGRTRAARSGGGAFERDDVLRLLRSGGGRPWPRRRLLDRLGGTAAQARRLSRMLRELEREGRVERFDDRVRLRRSDDLVEGEFQPRGKKGGLVFDDSGRVLRLRDARGARAGERVLVRPLAPIPGARPDEEVAEVLQVVSAPHDRFVGRIVFEERGARLEPFAASGDPVRRVRIARADLGGARDGEVVEAVPQQRGRSHETWARVRRRIGLPGEPDTDYECIAWRYRLPRRFPKPVEEEAVRAARTRMRSAPVTPERSDPAARRDLRHLDFVTIDPETARDHDDAVYVEPASGGALRLWVAIADVARFVEEGGAVEREALLRGNSVYLPDRAIPMLPEALSSDACSLVPDEDRLVLVAELEVSADGAFAQRRFHRGVIRSRARLAYAQAAAVMEGGSHPAVPAPLEPALRRLAEVARWLRERRVREGSIDLDLPDPEVELDERGHVKSVHPTQRNVAHRAIEEAMLAANRTVAEWLVRAGVTVVHRVHEPPEDDALRALREVLERFGLLEGADAAAEGLDGPRLSRALSRARGKPFERLVNFAALRAMKQARYSPEPLGHFALAFRYYVHFTSPIRRIADLFVHRAMHRVLEGRPEPEHAADQAASVASRASIRERVAERAERDAVSIKQAAHMADRIGECFDGHVSGITDFGVFVSIPDPFVDGMIEVSELGDDLEFDPAAQALVARRSGRRIALGDPIRVCVESVDVFRRWIRFTPDRPADRAGDRGAGRDAGRDAPAASRRGRARRVSRKS